MSQQDDPIPPSAPEPESAPTPATKAEIELETLPWDIHGPEQDQALPPWFRRAVITVLILLIVSRIVVWGFGELTSFWFTLFFAFFFGLALEPPVNQLAARGMRRGLATILVMGGLAVAVSLFFLVFGNLLAEQLGSLITSLPDILTSVVDWVNQQFGTQLDPNTILDTLGVGAGDIAKAAANLGVGLLAILGTAIGWVFSMFTVALFTFYFTADGPSFRRAIASWLPPNRQRMFLTVWDISTQKAGGYVISRGILATISGIFHGIVFFIVDLPYWLPMAMWVGLVSQFVPTIGTYLAGALPIIIALVAGEPITALIILIAVTIYQQIENYFISPRVTRSTLEIHPAVAFGSVIVGGSLFGGLGALLAIPVVAAVLSIIDVYGRRYALLDEFGVDAQTSDKARAEAAIRATDLPRHHGHHGHKD